MKTDALFDYVLIVSRQENEKPQISYRFPPVQSSTKKDSLSGAIVEFCFPESELDQSKLEHETFSFVLTESDAGKRFGYCRRFPAGKGLECYCILSYIPSFSLFSQLLDIVEQRRGKNWKAKTEIFVFLNSVLANHFPEPGESVLVQTVSSSSSEPARYQLSRPAAEDYLLDFVSYAALFKALSVAQIVYIFGSLILERRVILCAPSLSLLSSCVNALSAALSPLNWQHVFIPVVPNSLMDYCAAPMPFFVGILSSSLPILEKLPLEDVLLVDLFHGRFLRKPAADDPLPPAFAQQMALSLSRIVLSGIKNRAFDLQIARCIFHYQFDLLGPYQMYLIQHKFDRDSFLAGQPHDRQRFYQELESSQMWEIFLREREKMSQKGTLGMCPLTKEAETPWREEDNVSLKCDRCQEVLANDFVTKRGHPVCLKCASKFDAGSFFKSTVMAIGLFSPKSDGSSSAIQEDSERDREDSASARKSGSRLLSHVRSKFASIPSSNSLNSISNVSPTQSPSGSTIHPTSSTQTQNGSNNNVSVLISDQNETLQQKLQAREEFLSSNSVPAPSRRKKSDSTGNNVRKDITLGSDLPLLHPNSVVGNRMKSPRDRSASSPKNATNSTSNPQISQASCNMMTSSIKTPPKDADSHTLLPKYASTNEESSASRLNQVEKQTRYEQVKSIMPSGRVKDLSKNFANK
eukprot:TRINITY_DN4542_c0_g1_i1.p1 TRINITY_DN4542_c0_g1~~TRINITY_DN4542_c0_g1_i1.p1  ORF type:complete len:692 (-),score=133.77 TRINITY_DN4542_c0_g1_i1:58-2133(-)